VKSEVAAGVIAATPPAALVMILFTITTLAADPVQFDASSGGAALFAAVGVDATTTSFDAALQLASDDDVKFRDEYRYTVLHKMQEFHDWPRQIGAAIARGCDIDAANEYGDTALHFAALHNRQSSARTLLARGADRALKNEMGQTASEVATLLQQKSLATYIDFYDGHKLLEAAGRGTRGEDAARDDFDAALAQCTDKEVRLRSENRHTVLHLIMMYHEWPAQAAAVLARGVPIDAKDNSGMTALHRAAMANRTQGVRILVERAADRYVRANNGRTAADIARERGNTKLAEYIDDPAGTTTKSLPKELASLLFELGLGEKVDVAGKWCYEMGAESLEDLGETQGFGDTMDFVMEFAMALEPLPPIKKAKLVRRIRQALAKHKTEL